MKSRSCILVAEIGINHNGNLKNAKMMIDMAISAGFDFVKFQKRDCDVIVPEEKKHLQKKTPWGTMDYIDYKKRLELSQSDFDSIDVYCKGKGIGWFASPWDVDSVEFLDNYNVNLDQPRKSKHRHRHKSK